MAGTTIFKDGKWQGIDMKDFDQILDNLQCDYRNDMAKIHKAYRKMLLIKDIFLLIMVALAYIAGGYFSN